jgi:hypothetical protein
MIVMHVYEILLESKSKKQLDELDLGKIGTSIGKGVGATAKGIGAVAGGIAGIGAAAKKGYRAGKGTVSGDAVDSDTGSTSSDAKTMYSSKQAKQDADMLLQNIGKVRSRDRQAVIDYIKQSLDKMPAPAKAAPSVAAPVAAAPAKNNIKIANKKKPAAAKPAVAI